MVFGFAPAIVYVPVVLVILYSSLVHLFGLRYDPREPPVIPHVIPYIGHVLGLIGHGQKYFELISANNKSLPIFTLQTATKRTYVIASADLVTACERNQKTLSFFPFVEAFSSATFGLPKHGRVMEIIRNTNGKDDGIVQALSKGMHGAMAPGPNLDHMIRNALTVLGTFFDELAESDDLTVNLYAWIRPRFTIASTEAVYGLGNPFKCDPELEGAFWDFNDDFTKIILGIFPRLLARKGLNGRRRIQKAFVKYFERGDLKNGLGLIKARYNIGTQHGATMEDVALFEIGVLIGVLTNAQPTFFWLLLHIYSDPALLADIRHEISNSSSLHVSTLQDGNRKHSLDTTILQETCPLLLSSYRELLRYRTLSSTNRWVTEDTLLEGKYLLKKDSVLLIPGALIHSDPVWGLDAKKYNPRRFLKTDSGIKPGAYRAWGGGQTLCPGRFFATAEIVSAVAMVVMRFDMSPLNSEGWKLPDIDTSVIATSISQPTHDVKVRITEKQEYKGDQWEFKFPELSN